jgi:hypothetical protein
MISHNKSNDAPPFVITHPIWDKLLQCAPIECEEGIVIHRALVAWSGDQNHTDSNTIPIITLRDQEDMAKETLVSNPADQIRIMEYWAHGGLEV